MIGFLEGKVLFSDGQETLLTTASGVGYEIRTGELFSRGQRVRLYISHIIREAAQELFGFSKMREKKLFELILSVKGVGPKGAHALVQTLGFEGVMNAIQFESKKSLQQAPGVGAKAAAQILLDLKGKIKQMALYHEERPLFKGAKGGATGRRHISL